MGGLNHAETFKRLGVSKTGRYQAPPSAFTIKGPGHYLHDPHSPTEAPEWMIDSIDKHGLIVDLVVKREGNELVVDDGRTRVLAGLEVEKRRAARKPPEPPPLFGYKLLDGTEDDAARAMDIANTQRRIVGMATKAEMIAGFKARGFPPAEIAGRVAELVKDLEKIAVVNDCCAKVRELMESGRLDWRRAPEFAAMSPADQVAKARELVASGATHGAKAKAALRGEKPKRTEGPRPMTPRALVAMRSAVNGERAPVADLLALVAGDPAPLLHSAPNLAEVLIAAAKDASKPGRKVAT